MGKKPNSPPKLPTTARGWRSRWNRDIETIRIAVDQLIEDRRIYAEFRQVIEGNRKLRSGAPFFDFVDRAYLSHILTAIRRIDDHDKRARSLNNLIGEIHTNVDVLSRDWFVNRFRDKSTGKLQYKRDWSGKATISAKRVLADKELLRSLCKRIRTIVDKEIAHKDRKKTRTRLRHQDIDDTIDKIHRLVGRYNALILNVQPGTPSLLSSTNVFRIPWIL